MIEKVEKELDDLEMVEGLSMTDLVALPENLRLLLSWVIRRKVINIESLSDYLGCDEAQTRKCLERMLAKGLVEEIGGQEEDQNQYRVQMKLSRNYRVPSKVWEAFEN